PVRIRHEQSRDIDAIHEVTLAAFLNAPHSDHNEQVIVQGLREAGALSVSLVAEQDGRVVGHLAVSPARPIPIRRENLTCQRAKLSQQIPCVADIPRDFVALECVEG
ncbi:GNAT family N-acetyltransferase, partial [Alloalcanivorax venustensis]|uniref:GNAT family N-acetyltransferase n=1 Tax=Alloalcanivorax venustensis TaxID=172371 RepID=UPI003C546156